MFPRQGKSIQRRSESAKGERLFIISESTDGNTQYDFVSLHEILEI